MSCYTGKGKERGGKENEDKNEKYMQKKVENEVNLQRKREGDAKAQRRKR